MRVLEADNKTRVGADGRNRSNSSKSGTVWQPDVSERNSTTLRKSTPPTLVPDGLPNGERTRARLSLRKPKLAVAAVWVEDWVSPPFVNLYVSVILRPQLAPVHAPQLTLMAAVALADTIASFIGAPPTIKWPNDILVGGKKLAGILTESSCDSERIEFVILGIGVNLNYPVDIDAGGDSRTCDVDSNSNQK